MHDQSKPSVSRRALLGGSGALMTSAALAASSAANANPSPADPQAALEPVIEAPATLTAAVRGSAYLDGLVYIASRHTVSAGVVRLGVFDPFTGEQVAVHDLDIGAASGNNSMTADDRYVYIGPAGSAFAWRFDPATAEVEQFAEVGAEGAWTYAMTVHDQFLFIGTYPECRLLRVGRETGEVTDFGRVGASQYAVAVAVDEQHVFASTAAPGELKVYDHDGAEVADLSAELTDSPVGTLALAASGGSIYVASGREVISMRPDGSERVARPIPEQDRYIDKMTVTAEGRVLALARLTTNYYEVTADGLELLGTPWQDVENQGFFAIDDQNLVGVTGVGHVWSAPLGGDATVTPTAMTDFGYPESVQSLLAHTDRSVWAAGHFAMTVHYPSPRTYGNGDRPPPPARREPVWFEVNGEPKSMAQTGDGTVVIGLYPSTQVVAIDPGTLEQRLLGTIDTDQMRPLSMAYDSARGDVLVATTAKQLLYTGAVTFVNPATGAFEVREDFLPDQNLRNIVVEGDFAYIAGDTFAEATSERRLETATIAEIDLASREVSRIFEPRDWDSYETITISEGILYAVGRRPNGAWFAFDLETETVVAEGDTGGYGGLGAHQGKVYSRDTWTESLQQLSLDGGGSETVLYEQVPSGWYNRPEFGFVRSFPGTWGMDGLNLAWFPLPR